ncbi:competence protein CoiA family protein [Bacillus salipaludis]|uniref:competence protein CoiA n=1 Tax=Bacillus salipaludis TaxID=2547811 RepID=UPI003D1A5CAF
MLTARTKNGQKICLGYNYKKETLLYFRSREEFFCPVCGERVLLKLGDQRMYHFSHIKGGECRNSYENESVYHMEGKLQLYHWLLRQKIPAVLEYYDKEIQQRPDIKFTYENQKYALEFQCSPIADEIFFKRTRSYVDAGYVPLWILGNEQIHQKKKNILSLSNFHYLFIQQTVEGNYYLPSYCPEKKHFHLLDSIVSYSIKNALIQNHFYPISKVEINCLLKPECLGQINLSNWNSELEKANMNWALHPNSRQNSFLHEIYQHNLNLFLLPPEIGLPVHSSLLIQTSPIIWQTYVYLDILAQKHPMDIFTVQEVERSFYKRIGRKEIIIRDLPLIKHIHPFTAVMEYLFVLEKLGIMVQKGNAAFQLNRNIPLPQSNREREDRKKSFFQKYQRMISKR